MQPCIGFRTKAIAPDTGAHGHITRRQEACTEEDSTIQVPMNRSDIADYLGLTIETVSRTLTQLKREEIIDLPNNTHVILQQVERLRALAEGN